MICGGLPWRGRSFRRLRSGAPLRGCASSRQTRSVHRHAHRPVRNYWGGSSNATTQMLDALHYRGLVRVVRRENGIRIYRAHQHEPVLLMEVERRTRIDALVNVVVNIYAPLPGSSLSFYI